MLAQNGLCPICPPSTQTLVETVQRPAPHPLTRADEYQVLILDELRAIRQALADQKGDGDRC